MQTSSINVQLLKDMLTQGYVRQQKHPEANLWIYNYTAKAQYERVWNEITLQCRGLIMDENMCVVARPFHKFFNLGESDSQLIPNEPFEVFEKMDGSLGILYWLNDEAFIATRGSFQSEQAIFASQLLRDSYQHVLPSLNRNKTYLFEIIYPENRIVVDYGDKRDLVLLAIINTQTGKDETLENIGFPMVKKLDGIQDITHLKALEEENKEGFVIKFQTGLRYKVKFEEYVRIHRIITEVSSLSIWAYLSTGQSMNEILEQIPDEFYNWVRAKRAELIAGFEAIEQQCRRDFKVLNTRKETATYFLTCLYPGVLFAMLDDKSYDSIIWKMLRPAYERPYVGNSKSEEA